VVLDAGRFVFLRVATASVAGPRAVPYRHGFLGVVLQVLVSGDVGAVRFNVRSMRKYSDYSLLVWVDCA